MRFVENFPTSSGVARIVTDQGEAFIKPLGNALGPHALACEFVATSLARRLAIPTFDFSIMTLTESDDFQLGRGKTAQPGSAFVTRMEKGEVWDGSRFNLDSLANPDDITRIVVFDNWVLNCDRYPPNPTERKPNVDNVFLSYERDPKKGPTILAIDHTHCFTCNRDLTPAQLDDPTRQNDRRLYGVFPEFAPFLSRERLLTAIASLRLFKDEECREIIREVPRDWEVGERARSSLQNLIMKRAGLIVDGMESLLAGHLGVSGNLAL